MWIAASCVGAIEVPIDPELRGTFLDHLVNDAGIRRCVAPAGQGTPPGTQAMPIDGVLDAKPARIARYPTPKDTSCILYTSGTTGPAKGVVIPWGQISATIGRLPRSGSPARMRSTRHGRCSTSPAAARWRRWPTSVGGSC